MYLLQIQKIKFQERLIVMTKEDMQQQPLKPTTLFQMLVVLRADLNLLEDYNQLKLMGLELGYNKEIQLSQMSIFQRDQQPILTLQESQSIGLIGMQHNQQWPLLQTQLTQQRCGTTRPHKDQEPGLDPQLLQHFYPTMPQRCCCMERYLKHFHT